MKKIGVGNTAEVYEYQDGKICKLFYSGYAQHNIDREYQNACLIQHFRIQAPKAYGIIGIEERTGIIYDYIQGKSMLTVLLSEQEGEMALKQMTDLHKSVLDKHTTDCISYKEFLLGLIDGREEEYSLREQIEHLPDGDHLCHGDYHPGNILVNEQGKLFLIDFMNVCHGPKEFDIARTYYLLTESMLPAGLSQQQVEQITEQKRMIGELYLRCMEISLTEIQQYLTVIAECRKYEG